MIQPAVAGSALHERAGQEAETASPKSAKAAEFIRALAAHFPPSSRPVTDSGPRTTAAPEPELTLATPAAMASDERYFAAAISPTAEAARELRSGASARTGNKSPTSGQCAELPEPKSPAAARPQEEPSTGRSVRHEPASGRVPQDSSRPDPAPEARLQSPGSEKSAPPSEARSGNSTRMESSQPSAAAQSSPSSSAAPAASAGATGVSASTGSPATARAEGSPSVAQLTGPSSRSDAARLAAPQSPPSHFRAQPDDNPLTAQALRGLAAALRQNGGSVTLRLNPEQLGFMKIEMSLKEGRVDARIEASNDAARHLLEQSVDRLRAALEARGLIVDRLEVKPVNEGAPEPRGMDAASDAAERRDQSPGTPAEGRGERNGERPQGESRHGRRDPDGAPPLEEPWIRLDESLRLRVDATV